MVFPGGRGSIVGIFGNEIGCVFERTHGSLAAFGDELRVRIQGWRAVFRNVKDDGIRILFLDKDFSFKKTCVHGRILAAHHAVGGAVGHDRIVCIVDQIDDFARI